MNDVKELVKRLRNVKIVVGVDYFGSPATFAGGSAVGDMTSAANTIDRLSKRVEELEAKCSGLLNEASKATALVARFPEEIARARDEAFEEAARAIES